MTIGIHQLLPALEKEDAIGNYARFLQAFLREKGFDSRIFVFRKQTAQRRECFPYLKHRRFSSSRNVLIFHTAIGSPLADYFRNCPDKKILIHHNITPTHFFLGHDPEAAYLTQIARGQLPALAGSVDASIADSPYNARELKEMGFPEPSIIPLVFDWERLGGKSDENVGNRYRDGRTNLLFVGRVAPHKKQEDVIRIHHLYRSRLNPNSRLFLVGDNRSFPTYTKTLFKLVRALGATDVIFTGKVTPEELRSYYRLAHAFVCMSEHEGLGVPLVEAMFYRIPVVAYAAAAVPSTLKDAGILIGEKRPLEAACLIDRILKEPDLKAKVIRGQDRRLEYFKRFPYREKWEGVINRLVRAGRPMMR